MKKAGTLSLVLMNLTRTLPLLTGGAMMGTDSQVFCRRESSQRTSPGASPFWRLIRSEISLIFASYSPAIFRTVRLICGLPSAAAGIAAGAVCAGPSRQQQPDVPPQAAMPSRFQLLAVGHSDAGS